MSNDSSGATQQPSEVQSVDPKLPRWIGIAGIIVAILCLSLVAYKVFSPSPDATRIDATIVWLLGVVIIALLLPIVASFLLRLTSFKAGSLELSAEQRLHKVETSQDEQKILLGKQNDRFNEQLAEQKRQFEKQMEEQKKQLQEQLATKSQEIIEGIAENETTDEQSTTSADNQQRLPQKEYVRPILQVLLAEGGSVPANTVLDHVGQILERSGKLTDADRELIPITTTKSEPRWRNTARWARLAMRVEGLLETSLRGTWTISQKGIEELAKKENT